MAVPTQRNRRALNMAWVSKWKKARSGMPSPRLKIITPSWLSVEKATIFLKSNSTLAEIPARSIVIAPVVSKTGWVMGDRLRVE